MRGSRRGELPGIVLEPVLLVTKKWSLGVRSWNNSYWRL
jgi:hypothetical protein